LVLVLVTKISLARTAGGKWLEVLVVGDDVVRRVVGEMSDSTQRNDHVIVRSVILASGWRSDHVVIGYVLASEVDRLLTVRPCEHVLRRNGVKSKVQLFYSAPES